MPFGPTNAPAFYSAMIKNTKDEWVVFLLKGYEKFLPLEERYNIFNCKMQRQYSSRASPITKTFPYYIKYLPKWKQMLIRQAYISYPTTRN